MKEVLKFPAEINLVECTEERDDVVKTVSILVELMIGDFVASPATTHRLLLRNDNESHRKAKNSMNVVRNGDILDDSPRSDRTELVPRLAPHTYVITDAT